MKNPNEVHHKHRNHPHHHAQAEQTVHPKNEQHQKSRLDKAFGAADRVMHEALHSLNEFIHSPFTVYSSHCNEKKNTDIVAIPGAHLDNNGMGIAVKRAHMDKIPLGTVVLGKRHLTKDISVVGAMVVIDNGTLAKNAHYDLPPGAARYFGYEVDMCRIEKHHVTKHDRHGHPYTKTYDKFVRIDEADAAKYANSIDWSVKEPSANDKKLNPDLGNLETKVICRVHPDATTIAQTMQVLHGINREGKSFETLRPLATHIIEPRLFDPKRPVVIKDSLVVLAKSQPATQVAYNTQNSQLGPDKTNLHH